MNERSEYYTPARIVPENHFIDILEEAIYAGEHRSYWEGLCKNDEERRFYRAMAEKSSLAQAHRQLDLLCVRVNRFDPAERVKELEDDY